MSQTDAAQGALSVMEKVALAGVSARLIEAVRRSAHANDQLADAGVMYLRRQNGETRQAFKTAHDWAVSSRGALRDCQRTFEESAEDLVGEAKAASRMRRELIAAHSPIIRRCGMCGGDISDLRLDARWCGGTCYQRSYNALTGRRRKQRRPAHADSLPWADQ